MKFSDVIIAAAFLFVVSLMLDAVFFVVFAPLNSSFMIIVAVIISSLVASIIVGYVFAMQIREESRLHATGSTVILANAGMMIFFAGFNAIPLASPAMRDIIQSIFPTGGWTNFYWFAFVALMILLAVLLCIVFDFVGLYVGSMFRKPKKT